MNGRTRSALMILVEHLPGYLRIRTSGRLTAADYHAALPEIETAMDRLAGPARFLVRLEDFRGWEFGALWEELRFDIRRGDDIGRVAVVGENKAQEWASKFSSIFFNADVRYFARDEEGAAKAWLLS